LRFAVQVSLAPSQGHCDCFQIARCAGSIQIITN
jgi:hypothetical protein